jgi:hypothetical protein
LFAAIAPIAPLEVPRLDADGRQPRLGQAEEEPLRQRASLEANALKGAIEGAEGLDQSRRLARYLCFQADAAVFIDDTHARHLERYIEAGVELGHGASPSQMCAGVVRAGRVPMRGVGSPTFGEVRA